MTLKEREGLQNVNNFFYYASNKHKLPMKTDNMVRKKTP